ncbi:MAG: polysaccharide lyase 6 family protein, partial [Pseudomonadota bacterium]|nr:polysaccharide lyase 6 family protein [Pseudomonadota bacterium]
MSGEPLRRLLVANQEEYEAAQSVLQPGDVIVLANGEWRDFDLVLEAEGTAEHPIYLVAEEPGSVVLTGQSSLRLGGEYLIVSGLVFRDGYTPRNEVISFRRDSETLAFNSRVTRTVVENYNNPDRAQRDTWVVMYGQNNEFDHNHMSGKLNSGPTMTVRLNSEDSQNNGHHIHHNYFGPRPVFGSNGGET